MCARPLGAVQLYVVASPDYLARYSRPTSAEGLAGYSLIGLSEPESCNLWPVRDRDGMQFQARPALSASS